MSEAQLKAELGLHPQLEHFQTIGTLPQQHIVVFRKK
jgi:hypothetical protein